MLSYAVGLQGKAPFSVPPKMAQRVLPAACREKKQEKEENNGQRGGGPVAVLLSNARDRVRAVIARTSSGVILVCVCVRGLTNAATTSNTILAATDLALAPMVALALILKSVREHQQFKTAHS